MPPSKEILRDRPVTTGKEFDVKAADAARSLEERNVGRISTRCEACGTALRPLLEQQEVAVAQETPECACGWKGDPSTPESAAKQFQSHLASLHQTNTRLNRRVTQAEAANSVTVEDCRRHGVSFGRSLANAECNRLTAENERLQKRLVSALDDTVIYERNNAELTAAVATLNKQVRIIGEVQQTVNRQYAEHVETLTTQVETLTAERDEAREIAKRWHAHASDGRTGHGNYWPEERKKIAAWSGETQ